MLRIAIIGVLLACAFGAVLRPQPRLPDHRIVGGELVDISEVPHQLSLRIQDSHACGASIISSQWALTAAHCTGYPLRDYTISSGSSYRRFGVIFNVSRIVAHPQYDDEIVDFDYALIKIKGEFEFGPNTQPIKVADEEPTAGSNVTVTGWGTTSSGGSLSELLLKVSVPIVDRAKCSKAYAQVGDITENMLCAGYLKGGKDACQGDSGGPLIRDDVLYGIVSWGYGCAKPRYPGIYSNVASARSWVKKVSGV